MPSKTRSILFAGVIVGLLASLLSLIPYVGSCFVCLAYLGAGMLAVWHYTDAHRLTIPAGPGAGMGALAGIVAFLIPLLIGLFLSAAGLTAGFAEAIEQGLANSRIDPAQADEIEALITSPLFIVAVVALMMVLVAIVGAVGGAVGAALFKKGEAPPAPEESV